MLRFPQAYKDFDVAESLASSINSVGTAVPHAARPPVVNSGAVPLRAWVDGVPVDREALAQLEQLSAMSDVVRHPIVGRIVEAYEGKDS